VQGQFDVLVQRNRVMGPIRSATATYCRAMYDARSYCVTRQEATMRRTVLAVVVVVSASALAVAAQGFKNIREVLTGYQEVPVVSTTASGELRARISNDGSSIDYQLSYADLEGAVQQAHIHIGQTGVNGGISVFLCTNLGNGPAGTQPCPPPPATISGTINATDVSPNIAATAAARTQGVDTGEMDELVAAIRAGAAYVNVHSSKWPGGEIRKQINGNSGQ
jgi:hypothetical protein